MQPSPKLIFDFADLPQNHVRRQANATEQLCVLCGVGRRAAKRLSKTVFAVLSSFELDEFVENAIHLQPLDNTWQLRFRFLVRPASRSQTASTHEAILTNLNRLGQRLPEFSLTGSVNDGWDIKFAERLPKHFLAPPETVLKQWKSVIYEGDWESAFNKLTKLYQTGYHRQRDLREQLAVRRSALKPSDNSADWVLSLVASKTDNAVVVLTESGKLDWLNDAFSKATGMLPAADDGTPPSIPFASILDADSAQTFMDQLAYEASFALSFSVVSGRPDAEHSRWFEFQMTPIKDDQDHVIRWIGIGVDITQRHQADRALQEAKELADSASRAKSDFLAMMSHEIRTPMNAIIGMTELTLHTQLTVDQREYLTTANNAAHSLLHILNDILDLSKAEAHRLQIESVEFNLADLVRNTLDTLSVLAQRNGLPLKCDFPLTIEQHVVGDPMRLRQVIVNLLGNAIKFTPAGFIACRVDLLDETDSAMTLQFSITDSGIGIPADKTAQIFEAFFQSDTSIHRNFGGTGLGLSITSELVRLMNGRIWVESKLGAGSQFHFVIPLQKAPSTVAPKMPDRFHGRRLLILAAPTSDHAFYEQCFGEWEMTCQFAVTLEQADSIIDHQAIDAILLDLTLLDSERNLETTAWIQNISGTKCPIILLAPSDRRQEAAEKCRTLSIGQFLIQPVSAMSIANALQFVTGERVIDLDSANAQSISQHSAEHPCRVLVVDDHASNRKLMGEVVRRRGHRWTEVESGRQALEQLRRENFDIVLMDVQMPGMDGLETTREIRRMAGPMGRVPIIAVTAYAAEEDRARCLAAGMNDYLSKPINLVDFFEKLKFWGNQSSEPPQAASQTDPSVVIGTAETELERPQELLLPEPAFADAIARVDGDESLFRMQIGFFLAETPALLQQLHTAIESHDTNSVHHVAHRIKGLARTFDDHVSEELALRLESCGSDGDLSDTAPVFRQLEMQLGQLKERLQPFIR